MTRSPYPGWVTLVAGTFILAALAGIPRQARAGELLARSHSFVTAQGSGPVFDASDTRSQVLLLQMVHLRSEDVGLDGLRLEVSGLLGGQVADAPMVDPAREGQRIVGNLLVGLARWRSPQGAVSLTLGRQYLFPGAGRAEHLDGLTVTYRSPWHVDATVFGGRSMPWQLDYEPDNGVPEPDNEPWAWSNYAVGGRLRFRLLEQLVATTAFIHEAHGAEVVRQNLTLDLGYWNYRFATVLAGGIMDIVAGLPQEAWVMVTSRPLTGLKLSADYSYLVPALALSKTSIFSVFSEDAYHDMALRADYAILTQLSAGLEGGLRLYPGDDDTRLGYTVAGSVNLSLDEEGTRFGGLRVELLQAEGDLMLQGRLFAHLRLVFGLYATAEVYLFNLWSDPDRPRSVFQTRLDQRSLSLGGLGVLGYRFTDSLSFQVAGTAFSTPQSSYDLRLMGRLTYANSWGWGR